MLRWKNEVCNQRWQSAVCRDRGLGGSLNRIRGMTRLGHGPRMLEAYPAFHNYSFGNALLALDRCTRRNLQPGRLNTYNGWLKRVSLNRREGAVHGELKKALKLRLLEFRPEPVCEKTSLAP